MVDGKKAKDDDAEAVKSAAASASKSPASPDAVAEDIHADGPPDKWIAETLEVHNELRALHGAPPLKWSEECFVEAKKQAEACQAKSTLFHGYLTGASGRHGQNA